LQISLESQENTLDLIKITCTEVFMYFIAHRPKTSTTLASFFKIDYVKAWKILGRKPLIVFQEIETTTLTNILDHST